MAEKKKKKSPFVCAHQEPVISTVQVKVTTHLFLSRLSGSRKVITRRRKTVLKRKEDK